MADCSVHDPDTMGGDHAHGKTQGPGSLFKMGLYWQPGSPGMFSF